MNLLLHQISSKAKLRISLIVSVISLGLKPFMFFAFAAAFSLPAFERPLLAAITFETLPGKGTDISVGANGTAWMVGYDTFDKERDLYRWTGSDWELVDRTGTRIAVDPQGNPWVLNSDGDVKHYENGNWTDKPGRGTDIAVGANGDVWMVGWYNDLLDTDANPENRPIFRWTGSDWEEFDREAVRIAVASDGTPWIIDNSGQIFRRNGPQWIEVGGRAQDIGIGPDGAVWVTLLTDDWGEDGDLAVLQGDTWVSHSRSSVSVTVDPQGLPWFSKGSGDLFRGITAGSQPPFSLSMPIVSDGKVEFTFPTVTGLNYVVQVWRDLNLPPAELDRIIGTGSTVTVTDTPPAGTLKSFYNVVQK